MDRELIDRAWRVLPAEFKEEVKNYYQHTDSGSYAEDMLESIFGPHNLASDAEGEETLIVPRNKVQEQYALNVNALREGNLTDMQIEIATKVKDTLYYLFGSKCLPDEEEFAENANCKEPKPAEPKFKLGDKVKDISSPHDDGIYKVDDIKKSSDGFIYHIQGLIGVSNVKESDLEPYTEPQPATERSNLNKESSTCTDDCQSLNHIADTRNIKPIESKVSVYLATKKEDEEFRMLLHENGFVWNLGRSLIDKSNWASAPKDCQIHFVYPDKTVTYFGERTEDTLTFTEFKKRYFEENVNLSQETANCDKSSDNPQSYKTKADTNHFVQDNEMVDRIIKDSFSKERRLNIAAMAMQGLLANTALYEHKVKEWLRCESNDNPIQFIPMLALKYADALIKKSEKGDPDGK